ncbi:MAG: hypothetical protein HFH80_05325 [Lachnospiraceae bacterium]|nr:hypothetical protein [Lachnospiraceae bacterium]
MLVEKEKALRPGREGAVLAGIVLALLFCEIFLFNYKHWESLFYEPVEDAVCSLCGLEVVGDRYEIVEEEVVVEFSGIHRPVAYLSLNLEEGQQAEVTVGAVDEANASYLWTPVRAVRGDVAASQHLRLHFGRDIQRLRVVIRGLGGGSISRERVALNAAVPLCFSWLRFLLLAGGIGCLYLLRSSSLLYRVRTDLTRRRQWLLTAACIALQLLFFHGMLRWNTDALAWPAYMEHHQQYYRLAEALAQGRVDIGEASALEAVENPYDPSARAAAGLGAGDFKWDHAYYDGSYYVYFGVVPVVLFYLPWYLFTGSHLPHADCIFLLGALLMAGIAYLLWQMVRRWFPQTPYVLYLLLCVTMGAASGLGYAVYKPDLYLVPILAGMAWGVWGLAFWISAERAPERYPGNGRSGPGGAGLEMRPGKAGLPDPGRRRQDFGAASGEYAAWRLGAGSLCLALVAGCRPQMLLILAAGPVLFGRAVFRDRRLFSRKSMVPTLALCLPLAAVAAGLMWYNALRFGSVLEFGACYNLTTNDMTHRGWVWGRCGLGIFSYLLQPPRISSLFPFLQDFPVETAYLGLTVSERMVGGVLWLFPVLCFGFYGLLHKEWYRDRRCYGLAWISQLSMVTLAVADAQMAGLLTRYFGDFVWLGMVGSLFAILACYVWKEENGLDCRLLRRLVVMACAVTLLFTFLRIFAHSEDSIRNANPALYYRVQSLIAFWM